MHKLHHYLQVKNQINLYNENNEIIISIYFLSFINSELRIGDIIDNKKIQLLKDWDLFYEIKEKALEELKKGDCSTYLLKNKLLQQYKNIIIIDKVIIDLVNNHYLDEISQMENFIAKSIEKEKSKKAIIENAKKLQYDLQFIIKSLNHYDENEIVKNKVNKLFNKLIKTKSKKATLQTIYIKMITLGFEDEMINKYLNEFNEDIDDKDKLRKDFQKLLKIYIKKYENHELKHKLIEALCRKGYNYSDVKKVISEEEI